ncbi:hypothetical protein GCM10017783_22990 [Deinococcus piscis]|uniref:THIF-type NAD/FAD binding fold domain-containing protein n=1 Tax=Deinococcus piscis TaxID=394230 RepID=A0ABQ3KEE7_9DEIO|nr:PRTRC system ThiF family protein [Deinococcus piscis]GHG09890.1 hypothetical protein GCM10017783_22990 [Deinococcus piscis]
MHTSNLKHQKTVHLALIGLGGTGSALLSHLGSLYAGLQATGGPKLQVTTFDPDTVSPANLARQRFYPADLGKNKAFVLTERVNLCLGTGWQAVPEKFSQSHPHNFNIIVSCVDTRAARGDIAKFLNDRQETPYWLDCGNTAKTGQVILGRQGTAMALPSELHPELIDASLEEDALPSCSALEAISRQDLMINPMVAVQAADLLWKLLHEGEIRHSARYFDLESGQMVSRAVP